MPVDEEGDGNGEDGDGVDGMDNGPDEDGDGVDGRDLRFESFDKLPR